MGSAVGPVTFSGAQCHDFRAGHSFPGTGNSPRSHVLTAPRNFPPHGQTLYEKAFPRNSEGLSSELLLWPCLGSGDHRNTGEGPSARMLYDMVTGRENSKLQKHT